MNLERLSESCKRESELRARCEELEEKVAQVKIMPGLDGEILAALADLGYKGIVLEAYGAGGIPFSENENKNIDSAVKRLTKQGIVCVCVTQCLYDGVHMNRYEVGIKAVEAGIIPAGKYSAEAATVKLMTALGREIFPPIYFPQSYTLFPTWPIFDKIGTIALFILSMFMLIFPKFLGLIVYLLQNKDKKLIGGRLGAIKSVFSEIVISALFAPIMMMFQSKFVFDILTGNAVSWNTQNRDETGTSFAEAFRRHIWHTVLGIVTTIVVWYHAHDLFWWMLPITLGLILSIPVSVLTSRESLGLWFQKHHLFVIPEELREPAIIGKARKYRQKLESLRPSQPGVELVVCDGQANALHLLMLAVNGPAPQSDAVTTAAAQIKLENYINHKMPLDLSRDEEVSLLYDRDALNQAHLALRLEGRL